MRQLRHSLPVCKHRSRGFQSLAARLPNTAAVAREARSRHAFTALAVITLRCRTCGQRIAGEAAARAHAAATGGHAEFDEAPEP